MPLERIAQKDSISVFSLTASIISEDMDPFLLNDPGSFLSILFKLDRRLL